MSNASSPTSVCKKKLYAFRPDHPPLQIETQRTKQRRRREPADPRSIERGVRQLLADKVSGTMVGLWLLIPEHLRLGTWDLLCGWTQTPTAQLEPRLALQLVHEAALGVSGIRQKRVLSQKGFELAQGLHFVASDQAIHDLLEAHSVAQAQQLQLALGRLRRASGHFQGQLLAIDPHRLSSWSQRQMVRRCLQHKPSNKAIKTSQTFFILDAQTAQPVCFTIGSSARTVSQATPELLHLAEDILKSQDQPPPPMRPLVLADCEHFTEEILRQVRQQSTFDLLVPMPNQPYFRKRMAQLPEQAFRSAWAGYATAKIPCPIGDDSQPFCQIVQRCGEVPSQWSFKSFIATADRPEVETLTVEYPQRWHIEEFFRAHQSLGWQRAGTLNLHIRYGQMTMALIAQATLHQLRQRLGQPFASWDSPHFSKAVLQGLDGDIRVSGDTILVTYYNAPQTEVLRQHYEHLPEKLQREKIDPRIPWLYRYKLDFRFK